MSDRVHTEYAFNRRVCVVWTVFFLVMVAVSIAVALSVEGPMLPGGWVPSRLLGGAGAALFSVMAYSWGRRLGHTGPAVVLSDEGIAVDGRAGGLTTASIEGVIPWSEIESASPDAFGSVILRLDEPDAFWARQSSLTRALAWHPLPELRGKVIVGGHDVADGPVALIDAVNAALDGRVQRGAET